MFADWNDVRIEMNTRGCLSQRLLIRQEESASSKGDKHQLGGQSIWSLTPRVK